LLAGNSLICVKKTAHGHKSGGANFICAAPASSSRVGERAGHLLPNTLNRPAADTKFAGNLQDSLTATQLRLDAFFKRAA
jgi:hypothetical protein